MTSATCQALSASQAPSAIRPSSGLRARIAGAALLAAASAFAPAGAMAQIKGGTEISDLAERVIESVVNISAATAEQPGRQLNIPGLPPGTPFEDLFEEFFNRRNQQTQPGQPAPQRPQRRSNSLGSGFVVDASGIVVTNNHVIGEATDITVIFPDGQRLKAEVVGKDAKIDVAVLRVKPDKPLKAVKFADSEKVRIGEWVVAIGNPFGLGGSVSAGIISARNRNIDSGPYDNYIQTDAAINKGNSGGPLFNMQGEVIGINTAILSPSGGSIGIGFAVPAATAKPVVDQLLAFGETRRGWLGVRIQNVDDTIAESLGLGSARGALIAGIDDKGPAKPAGIETGDVVVRFDGQSIRESRDLPRIVAATPVGKAVDVLIVRKGQEITRTVTLGRLEDGERAQQAAVRQPVPESVTRRAMGLDLSPINEDTRKRFSIKDTVKGVVVTRVEPNSSAADKRIQAGDVIVEVGQEAVTSPADIQRRVDQLKKDGRKSALLLVANAQGDVRFVAVTIE